MYKIVFLGSGDLACGVLQGLLESEHSIVGVLPWESLFKTHWRARIKRRLVTDTSTLIEQHGLPRLRPSKANSSEFAEQMAHLAPDLLLVASRYDCPADPKDGHRRKTDPRCADPGWLLDP